MESDGQPASLFGSPTYGFSDLVGAVIALFTLIFPLMAIARYSPSQLETPPSPQPALISTTPSVKPAPGEL
ncbi:MAG: hypothetical protein KFF72_17270 [Arthrospira sp. SH-MAG29]|nr:hypothetical protein [Arthrospira sp. SH-MAG29]MBS0018073.1 hypothetical protein [Arthrospira sp. SH-MAG29]